MSAPGDSGAPAVELRRLTFRYEQGGAAALDGVTAELAGGTRCLLVGRNGAGKSTLLSVLGGRHLVPEEQVRVLGRPAFHDTSLAARVGFLGGDFPFDADVPVADVLARAPGVEPERLSRLLDVLGVDPGWRMHRVSSGQRRRVQLLLGLVRPLELLLLDEITTDLDLVARQDLLRFLGRESEERGATIVYATHVLDGLDGWASHLAFLEAGRLRLLCPLDELTELRDLRAAGVASPLLRVVERWLRDPA